MKAKEGDRKAVRQEKERDMRERDLEAAAGTTRSLGGKALQQPGERGGMKIWEVGFRVSSDRVLDAGNQAVEPRAIMHLRAPKQLSDV